MDAAIQTSLPLRSQSIEDDCEADGRFISSFLPSHTFPTANLLKNKTLVEYQSDEDICDPDLRYRVTPNSHHRNKPRGICLLINQRDFIFSKTGQERRDGTDVDADTVERTFIRCGYTVRRATNLTLRKMELLLHDVGSQDHWDYDSFVCVVLSHGEDGKIYTSDGTIPVDQVVGYFRSDRCISLMGKPKLFFIQACRGSRFDKGVALSADGDETGGLLVTKLPIEADVLVANATYPGYFAWRNSQIGSWFIQEMCSVFKTDLEAERHYDLLSLLTVVARKVALLYESNTGQLDSHGMKQMVSISTTLTRKAFLV